MTDVQSGPKIRGVGTTIEDFEQHLVSNLYFQRGTTIESASALDAYSTLAVTIRDWLVDWYARTVAAHYEANPRFVYYLSAEYLIGPQLDASLLVLGIGKEVRSALQGLGLSLDELRSRSFVSILKRRTSASHGP